MQSLVKKYVMSLTGLILAGFVFVHLLGNLQIYLHPEDIIKYAYFLHHILPAEIIWSSRIFLLTCLVAHIWTAILLKIENYNARPVKNCAEVNIQSSLASRYMLVSGSLVLIFIIFHLLHYTVQNVYPEFGNLKYILDDKQVFDAYAMIIYGFSSKFWFVSASYIIGMALLSWHLSHGASSMFQSLGLRNDVWRQRLDIVSILFALLVFIGLSSVPAAVLISEKTSCEILPTKKILQQIDDHGWDGKSPIMINYHKEH